MTAAQALDTSPGLVKVEIPARAEWVAVARLTVAAVASRLRFSVDEIDDIKLAMAEACTTAINNADGSGSISITCEASEHELTLIVHDQTPRHDGGTAGAAGKSPDATSPEDLGVFLIRALMDQVDYTAEGGSHQLVMTKRVSE